MALKNTILYLLVIALNCNILEAQHYNVSVQHLGVTDGLSSRFINDIFQDSEGFIWLATNHGVNRYDAYEFKVLNQGKKYRKIAEDGHGDLWLVQDHHSGEQINRKIEILQKSTNRLIPLNEKLENCCDSLGINLVQNVGKTIWLKTMTGQMYSFYRELKQEVGLSRHTNTKTLIAGNENFPDQLWVIDQYRMKLVHRDGHILEADSVGSDQLISNPLFQADGSLHFVYHTIPHQEKYSFIKRQGEKIQPLHVFELAHRVNFKLYVEFPILQKYNDGIGLNWIWLGSRLLARDENGAIVFDNSSESYQNHFQKAIRKVLFDQQGNVWVASNEGIKIIRVSAFLFKKYLSKDLASYSTRGITTLGEEIVVNTYRGLKLINRHTGQFRSWSRNAEKEYMGLGIWGEADGLVFSGLESVGRIVRHDFSDQSSTEIYITDRVPHKAQGITNVIYRDRQGQSLWVGTNKGLFFYDSTHQNLLPSGLVGYPNPGHRVNHFYENKAGMWVASENGLYLIDTKQRQVLRHLSVENGQLPINALHFIHEDQEGIFWIATKDEGLLKWNPADGQTKIYAKSHGFLNLLTKAVYEDAAERLWIPTEFGLVMFDKATETTRVFLPKDGISHEEFNTYSHFRDQAGRLYLGGLDGFIVFHPDSIQVKSDNPIPLKLTGLQKLDGKQKRSVNIFPEFQENAELVLTDRDRLLDVSFALLDYSGEGIIHAYQLEGLEDEWNVLNDNHIRFASLPIGTYTIRVRAKSLGKPWSKHQLSIPIRILPPFYLNPSFYLPLLLLLGILIFSYYRYRTYQLQRRALLLEAQVKQRTSTIEKQKAELEQQKSTLERLIQTKDRFFAIIAHDLRGPLNNLHGLSKQVGYLIRKDRMEDVHLLGEKVEEATTGVTKLLDNLLAWALLQKETFPHDPRWIEISAIFEEILTIYRPAAEAKGVFIEFDIQHDKVHADKDAFSAIIRNLVDNALKFSRSSGKIKLKAFQENKQLIVEVSDQGVGIAPNEIDQLFAVDGKRRQRGTRGEKGVGLGLALCKELVEKHEGSISVNSHLEEGSTFRIVLPNQE